MLQLIKQLRDIAKKENLSSAIEKSFFMLLTVKYLGNEIGFNTNKPYQAKIAAIHEFPSPTTKIRLIRIIVSMAFYSKFIVEIQVIVKPL